MMYLVREPGVDKLKCLILLLYRVVKVSDVWHVTVSTGRSVAQTTGKQ